MESLIGRHPGMIALRGAAAVAFGVVALAWPEPTLAVLIVLLGTFLLADGIFAGLAAIYFSERRVVSWSLAIEAVVAVGTGLLIFFWPDMTAVVLLYLLAAWAILVGAIQLIATYQLRRYLGREWLMLLRGLPPLILGVMLAIFPQQGALALIRVVGLGVALVGLYLLVLAYEVWRVDGRVTAA